MTLCNYTTPVDLHFRRNWSGLRKYFIQLPWRPQRRQAPSPLLWLPQPARVRVRLLEDQTDPPCLLPTALREVTIMDVLIWALVPPPLLLWLLLPLPPPRFPVRSRRGVGSSTSRSAIFAVQSWQEVRMLWRGTWLLCIWSLCLWCLVSWPPWLLEWRVGKANPPPPLPSLLPPIFLHHQQCHPLHRHHRLFCQFRKMCHVSCLFSLQGP